MKRGDGSLMGGKVVCSKLGLLSVFSLRKANDSNVKIVFLEGVFSIIENVFFVLHFQHFDTDDPLQILSYNFETSNLN